jgi:hypothetical protein
MISYIVCEFVSLKQLMSKGISTCSKWPTIVMLFTIELLIMIFMLEVVSIPC